MKVCICNDVSERKIKKVIIDHEDIHSVEDLQKYLGVADCCRGCYSYIDKMIQQIDGGRTR